MMKFHTGGNAWMFGLSAAFGAASAQFGLALSDGVISNFEYIGIALQFATLLFGTVAKFDSPKEDPKE